MIKLTTLMIIISLMHVSAKGLSQQITLNQKRTSLQVVLREISKQAGYNLYYDGLLIPKNQKIDITVSKVSLADALRSAISGLYLDFEISNGSILIKKREVSVFKDFVNRLQLIDIRGKVIDENGNPLAGASITVKGKGKSVFSGQSGEFSIAGVDKNDMLIVSYVGRISKEVAVQESTMSITLLQGNNKLDEVQIMAYGETSKRLVTGNIASVKAKDIENSPVNNPLLAVAGRVPGVVINQSTGYAGSGVQIQIQGQNSIASGTVPFYVIDNVPYTQTMLSSLSSTQGSSNFPVGGGVSNPLSFINPQDIESIEVLKDADATAIYGSKAANGAILITTKKGRAGKTTVTANLQTGYGQVAKKIENLNTQEYIAMRQEAYVSQGLPVPTSTSARNATNYDLTLWDQNRYTDWQKELIGGKAKFNDAQLTFSGGNAQTQMLLGVNYHRETTVLPVDLGDTRGNIHWNVNHSTANQRFKLSFNGSYLADKNELPGFDVVSAALKLAPNAPALYDAEGRLNWETLTNSTTETWINPIRAALRKYTSRTNNFVTGANLSYRIWDALTFRSTFGYNRLDNKETLLTPQTYSAPSSLATGGNFRSAFYSDRISDSWIVEPQLSYKLHNRYGNFDFLLGTTFQRANNSLSALAGSGYTNDSQLESMSAATAISVTNFLKDRYNYSAGFARVSYNYKEKYLLNLSARRDGSSRFGSQNVLNSFYGVGAGWIFSEENWFKDKLPLLSFGKLRASWGTTGNDQIDNYGFMSIYTSNSVQVPYGGATNLRANRIDNPYLQWEETRKLNLGIDVGFLENRFLLTANFFDNRSSNQLLNYALPIQTGFNSITQNFPATVQNRGWEFSLSTENFREGAFKWNTNFNLTIARNKLLDFPNLASSTYANTLVIGKPVSIVKTFQYSGVNSETGRYNFIKSNGTVVDLPDLTADRQNLVDITPRFYGGLQNTFTYKGFALDFLLQFTRKKGFDETYFGYSSVGLFSATSSTGNQPASIQGNYWTQTGSDTPLQRLNPGVSNLSTAYAYASASLNDAAWRDASFIRLKNISVSYGLPVKLIEKAGIQGAKIFLQGQNVFTITPYKGLDPENTSSAVLPPLRVMTMGIQLTL